MADREYCYKENAFFPSSEFEDHPTHGRIHRTSKPHTVTGDDVPSELTIDVKAREPRSRVVFPRPMGPPSRGKL